MTTTETDVSEQIRDALYETGIYKHRIDSTTRFEDAGVMTNDTGFIAKMQDGSEFQITVKQSR